MKILLFLIISTTRIFAFAGSTDTAGAEVAAKCAPELAAVTVDCDNSATAARMACLAELSPHIQTGGMLIGGMMAAADFMKGGVAESCEKQNKLMGVAQKAITAYNAACSGTKLWCDNSCKATIVTLDADLAKEQGLLEAAQARYAASGPTNQVDASEIDLRLKNIENIKICQPIAKAKSLTCDKYMFSLAAAGAGLMQIINQSGAAKACKAALSDCSKNPTNPICFVDCSKAEHATKAQCICQKTPNAKGCPGAVAYEAGPGMQTTGNDLTEAPLNIPNPNFDGSGGGDGFVGGPGSSLGGGGRGGAGGGSGADSSNGFSGGGKAADGAGKIGAKRLNTDILSGIDGGGGGGGGGGRGGGAKAANSPYQAYLPGGEKDPARDLASANFAKEVTAGGSKSNWEKITERYQQFRPSLNAGP